MRRQISRGYERGYELRPGPPRRRESISNETATTVTYAGILVPLAGLEPALGIDQLALRQELAADLGEPIPRHEIVVLGPLRGAVAAKLVRGDREVLQCIRLHN